MESQDKFKGTPDSTDYSPEAVLSRIREMRREEPPTLRIPVRLVLLILIGIVIAGLHWYRGLGVPDIPLCVVNTSSDAPMIIRLDGKSIGTAPRMITEDPKAAVMGVLKIGDHKLEARNASGELIAQESFTVEKGSNGYLWTPLPDPAARFLFQYSEYGYSSAGSGVSPFEGNSPLRQFPNWVTQWFRDNPSAVSVRKGAKWDFERALRFVRQESAGENRQ